MADVEIHSANDTTGAEDGNVSPYLQHLHGMPHILMLFVPFIMRLVFVAPPIIDA